MGTRVLGAVTAALAMAVALPATAGAFATGSDPCPGSAYPYLTKFSVPVAPEGFSADCRVTVGSALVDARSGRPEILLALGDGVTVDPRGRLTHLTAGPSLDFTHPLGNVLTIGTGPGATETLSYDASGRVSGASGALGTMTASYDAAGNLVKLSFSGGSQNYAYDSLGRITSFTDSGGDSATLAYDTAGHLSSVSMVITMTDPTQTFDYDSAGNVLTWGTGNLINPTLSFSHNGVGDVTTVAAGSNTDATLTYAAAHRLSSVLGAGNTQIAAFTYDASGRLTQAQGSSPSQTVGFAYDSLGRLSSTTIGPTASDTLGYDGLGRITRLAVSPSQPTILITYLPAPTASTGPATHRAQRSATLTGSSNPNGAPIAYRFQFGATAAYGHSTAVRTAPGGTGAIAIAAKLTGLTPGRTYHYRLLVSSRNGSATGLDRTFKTKPIVCRVPGLAGKTLSQARAALSRSHCRLGHVTRPKHGRRHAHLRITSQHPGRGTILRRGSKVAVRLG